MTLTATWWRSPDGKPGACPVCRFNRCGRSTCRSPRQRAAGRHGRERSQTPAATRRRRRDRTRGVVYSGSRVRARPRLPGPRDALATAKPARDGEGGQPPILPFECQPPTRWIGRARGLPNRSGHGHAWRERRCESVPGAVLTPPFLGRIPCNGGPAREDKKYRAVSWRGGGLKRPPSGGP